MAKFLKNLVVSTGCSLLMMACTSLSQKHHIPSVALAHSLKGQSLEQVKAKLGTPQDSLPQNRYRWTLTEDSTHHPEPRLELHEFIFEKNRLKDIINVANKP